jgi:biopolymer transport protein ExbD
MTSLQPEEDIPVETSPESSRPILPIVLLVVLVVYIIASLYMIFDMRGRLSALEAAQKSTTEALTKRQITTEQNVKASSEALAQRLGMTEQELQTRMQARTAELQQQQRATEMRLAQQQKEQYGKVSGDVANVRTELGGAKTDIAATRTDLESTKAKLDRAIGDLNGQSSLIARTRGDLEELRHRGDRNYYEFALQKGGHPTPVSTISLQLKKADAKKGKFTLNVIADDRTIEKKDRGVAEPLQFYTGRDRLLYEIVIFTVEKNKVTGYLSTPKSVGAPISK